MKKLLNTLYISTQGIYLNREGETVVASLDRQPKLRLPIHTLSGIVCFGNVLCSPFLLGLCGERGVKVSFLTEHGRFLARVEGPVSGNVLLRYEQIRRTMDPEAALELAKNFVLGKVINSRTVIQRALRDHGDNLELQSASTTLVNIVRRVPNAKNIDVLRGYEGEAANAYFGAFNGLIVAQKKHFSMQTRSRRPPLDPLNALLSFLYVILAHDCSSALEGVGLDPQVGFLHALRPGRPSLALDLMEEFRSILVDRVVLTLINRQQISGRDFSTSESGSVIMKDDARKLVLKTWQEKKQETLKHPFLGERISIGLLPHLQALLLARHLRGDIDAYPPFLLK
ncbi:MAG: type I-C CRISPR-associated endonuclease Cas1 [Lentisphaerae bacterium]|jgi:CRISPR-associated protein Cas1|nr:type I-C CRISPR-associated endonuclease Cas1 [Lentisphaerota bacterium]